MIDPEGIPDETTAIQTDGGSSIKGDVTIEGDFTGRDAYHNPIIVNSAEDAVTAQAALTQNIEQTRVAYLAWMIQSNLYLDAQGVSQTQRQVQLKLDDIYIGLRAQADERPNHVDRKLHDEEVALLEGQLATENLSAEEAEDRLDGLRHRMIVQ